MTEPRVAIVTGAARGIGAATVTALANSGWSVVAVDICADDPAVSYSLATREELDRVVGDSEAVTACVADVRDPVSLAAAVELAETRYGGLDAAVAAAGVIGGGGPHWQTDSDTERAVIEIDLGGVLRLARATVPAMLRRPQPRSGRFLAVASVAGSRGLPGLATYCAAKAGVIGFVRALGADLKGTGVTANAVSPGSTRTDILAATAALYALSDREDFAAQQPISRLIEPSEVAAMLVFLAGPNGAAITGADVPVDGGLAI